MKDCPVCGAAGHTCGPPIGALLMATVTSDTVNPSPGGRMGTIIVTEPVYAEVDGRTILAAAVGEELTEAQAKQLGVGANGKSNSDVQPATSIPAGPEPELPGAVGQADAKEPAAAEGDSSSVALADLNVTDATARVNADDADLDALEAEERDGKARKGVLDAIAARREA